MKTMPRPRRCGFTAPIYQLAQEDVKEEKEDIKEYANTITTTVEGFLGCPIGSVFTFNEELGIWEHNWSNENVTRNVSFSANLFDRNSKFFKILSWGE